MFISPPNNATIWRRWSVTTNLSCAVRCPPAQPHSNRGGNAWPSLIAWRSCHTRPTLRWWSTSSCDKPNQSYWESWCTFKERTLRRWRRRASRTSSRFTSRRTKMRWVGVEWPTTTRRNCWCVTRTALWRWRTPSCSTRVCSWWWDDVCEWCDFLLISKLFLTSSKDGSRLFKTGVLVEGSHSPLSLGLLAAELVRGGSLRVPAQRSHEWGWGRWKINFVYVCVSYVIDLPWCGWCVVVVVVGQARLSSIDCGSCEPSSAPSSPTPTVSRTRPCWVTRRTWICHPAVWWWWCWWHNWLLHTTQLRQHEHLSILGGLGVHESRFGDVGCRCCQKVLEVLSDLQTTNWLQNRGSLGGRYRCHLNDLDWLWGWFAFITFAGNVHANMQPQKAVVEFVVGLLEYGAAIIIEGVWLTLQAIVYLLDPLELFVVLIDYVCEEPPSWVVEPWPSPSSAPATWTPSDHASTQWWDREHTQPPTIELEGGHRGTISCAVDPISQWRSTDCTTARPTERVAGWRAVERNEHGKSTMSQWPEMWVLGPPEWVCWGWDRGTCRVHTRSFVTITSLYGMTWCMTQKTV